MQLTQTVTVQGTSSIDWLTNVIQHHQVGGTIDTSNVKWVQADHYPAGYIPTGIAVAYDSAADRWIPFKFTGGVGAELNFGGVLYTACKVDNTGAPLHAVAIVTFGFVSLDKLPSAGAMVKGGLGNVIATARTNIAANAPTTRLINLEA